MFLANKLNKGAGVPAPVDAQFNYVTMLLHGDGTNGAQNNTFLDSSTNNFTITRNGNTTQGSFSPYGSNWSNYLGTSNYLSFANNANLNLGSGDFTIECWFFHLTGTGNGVIWSQWNNGGDTSGQLLTNGTGLIYRIGATQWTFGTFVANNWTHLAITRSGSTVRMFVNGVVARTETNSTNITTTGATVIGANDTGSTPANFFAGYISNFRQVKGTAVYTSDFTPSTTPLTAITNTQLLICQSNRFKDNSTNNFIATIGGSPSVQRFNPFGTSTAYSTSVIGGSGYFDGSGDYLNAPNNTAFQIGTGDFTYECWLYPTNLGGSQRLGFVTGSSGGFGFGLWTNTIQYGYTDIANLYSFTASDMINNQWIHFAVSRASGTMHSYVNGVRIDSRSNSTNFSSYDKACIGAYYDGGNGFTGYISDAKFTKGTGVYTGTTLTVPTAPVSAGSCTLLCSMTNAAIFDNAMMNDLETVGNAQISTSVTKFGTGSLAFDGTGDYLRGANIPDLAFGTGDFTVECWAYWTATVADGGFLGSVGTAGFDFSYLEGTLRIGRVNTAWDSTFSSFTPTAGVWYHIAYTRSSGTARAFVNGTQVGSNSTNNNSYSPIGGVIIGSGNVGDRNFKGYIDDLRITKGYARYTSNFTAPTAAFSDTGPY